MDSSTFRKFARLVGNEDDLLPLANEKYDEDMPENWDEMSEEDQAAWKEKHVVANTGNKPTPQDATPAVSSNTQAAQAQPASASVPAEITQLTALVQKVGGVDALETLLVNAARLSVNAQTAEDQERADLTARIKANSAEFTNDELKAMPIGTLRKFVNSLQPAFVDYSAVAPRMAANRADQLAPRPTLLLAARTN